MSIRRKFFDWSRPALPQIVEWLCQEYRCRDYVDLSEVVLVFPGRRAARHCARLLTEATGGRYSPPELITVGSLPEILYVPKYPFANRVVQRLAWAEALRTSPQSVWEELLGERPDDGDEERWQMLGDLLARHHLELARDGLNFERVALEGRQIANFNEHDRWAALSTVQDTYLRLLDGLKLWDRETARQVAVEHHECRTTQQIMLVATVDLNRIQRQMLDAVADHVTALVHAPESLADHFDDYGCLIPERWEERPVDLDEERVRVVDGPADQAAEVAYVLHEFHGQYAADEIRIALADESLTPIVQQQLDDCGVATRAIAQKEFPQTSPALLLEAVAAWLESDSADDLVRLVRHPDVYRWISSRVPGNWLMRLDNYLIKTLQPKLGDWLGPPESCALLSRALDRVSEWLRPLRRPMQSLGEWSQPIAEVLQTIYANIDFDPEDFEHRTTLTACRQLADALAMFADIPKTLPCVVSSAEAIRIALRECEDEIIPPPEAPEAIELLGWLEMSLDDAPAVIVTTFNEGFVPTSVNSDLFLPNGLRQQLGILDNTRRYARDVYALSVLLQSRESVTLVVGRRNLRGDPLKPSRLLFAADPEVIARRITRFFGDENTRDHDRPPLPSRLVTQSSVPGFRIPRPQPCQEPIQTISVTDFGKYLRCPYRYYLGRILRLEEVGLADELSHLDFGNLLHEVLEAFGRSELRKSTDPQAIRRFVDAEVDRLARQTYGSLLRPAVQLQLQQLKLRLHAFADRQARHRAEGWAITNVESTFDNVPFRTSDGRTVQLRGRIDRIDFNTRTGEWLVLDYKSSKIGDPDKTHRVSRKGGPTVWKDLQLVLYRHLAWSIPLEGPMQCGYFHLPADIDQTDLRLLDWSEEDFASGDEAAREVAAKILDQSFWPPTPPDKEQSDFARICQSNVFDREVLEEVLS